MAQDGGTAARIGRQVRWAWDIARLTVREPSDGFDWLMTRVAEVRSRGAPRPSYAVDHDWCEQLHERLGAPWPCAAAAEFDALWSEVASELRARGVSTGRGTYGGWDDGDRSFALAVWCLVSHLRPERVVETGVARGLTSRIILEGLERHGGGRLWSIDLPPTDASLHDEIGVAVAQRLRPRWTYVAGTSRRRLPGLLSEIGPIGLFVHDSSHTERNVLFELERAWPALARGAVIADDVQQSAGFARFVAATPTRGSYVVQAADGEALFGIALKGA